jgi:protein-L-isoaspartate(D-aspartate) O-methyltransferase
VFVPRFFDGDTEISDQNGEEWLRAVYTDQALLTSRRSVTGYDGPLPTSSSSQPTIMAVMLDRLAVRPGMRVLEVGTGTGYNAALLCARLGDQRVTTIDIDPALTADASRHLVEVGYRPIVAATDGAAGLPIRAPYDRILATCAITAIPPEWIRQLAPGGRIVAPLTGDAGALAVLDKTAPDEVTGHIDATPARFMPLRARIDNPLGPGESAGDTTTGMAHCGTTAMDPATLADPGPDLTFWLQLHLPGLRLTLPDPAGLTLHTADAHAHIGPEPNRGRWPTEQRGTRRIWDTIEHATATWHRLNQPERSRLGITALDDLDRQYIWLDTPDGPYSWPFPL